MGTIYRILIMGASYGSLLGTKLALAGHWVKLVCLPAEAELINREGAIVRLPVKGHDGLVEVNSKRLPGQLSAGGTTAFNPADFDLVALAMQEPQYGSTGVRELLDALAAGARSIERTDRLVQAIGAQKGKRLDVVDRTVELVDG